ncbi:hypothetical protein HY04_08215 [Kaistella antarctica]|uniref:Uncharacterized protein n=1 Tax=Kaistella antarctica TaxID=266748 RepID=A0ABR4TX05_9FLAO|nr:hypothetical protein HY04_08215 [Kaistella antarctica]
MFKNEKVVEIQTGRSSSPDGSGNPFFLVLGKGVGEKRLQRIAGLIFLRSKNCFAPKKFLILQTNKS